MTVDEFKAAPFGSIVCIKCGSPELDTRQKYQHIELFCVGCGLHQRYLSQKANIKKRPPLPRGTATEVWAGSDGHCAHCGLDSETLELLGLEKTVQHVPPFCVNGHEGYAIPLCSWCQQDSASRMRRLQSLVDRLTKKFSRGLE